MSKCDLILDIEGSPSDDELVQDASECPHVSLVVVSLTSEDLRTAVRQRPIAIVRVIVARRQILTYLQTAIKS